MPVEFKLPDVGEGVAEGELLEWYVQPGEAVTEDQVVAEVETDKAVVDVPSPVDGTVRELLVEPGQVVPVGTVIITFDVPEEEAGAGTSGAADVVDDGGATAPESTAGEAAAGEQSVGGAGEDRHPGGRVFAAPSVRRRARELGVDLATVEGSDPGGRVTEADVREASADGTDEPLDDSAGADESAGTELKPAVTRIDDESSSSPPSAASEIDHAELTSAVTRVDADEAGAEDDGVVADDVSARASTLAAPATRKVARDLGVDIDAVPPVEERDGEAFVTAAAVREYAEAQQRAQAADREAVAAGETAGAGKGERADEGGRETREPYRGVRRATGEAMVRSKFTAPHVTHHDTVDVSALVDARDRLRERATERDVSLTYLPFVMKAVVAALREHPVLNTTLDEENEEIVYRHYYDIGVATATDAGLMVPVVRAVDEKSLLDLASETGDLVSRARDRTIEREELRGSTFTITNFGAIGGEYATPIINPPETAILGLGAIRERPVVVDGEVVPRDVMTLSLSIDHRVIDGAQAARFVNTLKTYLADPTLLLLE